MNIVNKLTLRQLKLNKRRTLVTILGAIISVAMVTAVAVSVSSATDLMKRVIISSDGNWHMRFRDVSAEKITTIQENDNVEQTIIDYSLGYERLENPKNNNKPYLFVRAYNQTGFNLMPVKLLEGRLPENSGEIVIPNHLEANTGLTYKVGDQITLELGKRQETLEDAEPLEDIVLNQGYSVIRDSKGEIKETIESQMTKTYTVVGIMDKSVEEYSWSPGYEMLTYIDQNEVPKGATATVSVFLKHLNKEIYAENAALGVKVGVDVVEPHSDLLACYGVNSDGGLMIALFGVVGIVLIIIMAGSVSLIYNAFAISVAERSQYLGMLASVGATRKQKRASVFFEGAVIGSISIPLGLLAGFIGMAITFTFINGMFKNVMRIEEDLRLVVSPVAIVATVFIAILTIFISIYLPARRASRISAIEAIRQTQDIKISGKKIKTSKLTRKIFGFEGELALKNLKRNGRRYRATLFSLVVSIILFLTTATFSSYMNRSLEMMIQNTNYDMRVWSTYSNNVAAKVELEKLIDLEKVDQHNLVTSSYFNVYLSEEMTPDFIKEKYGEKVEGKGYLYWTNVTALEDEAFKAYAKHIGIEMKAFANTNEPTVIVLNRAKFKDKKTNNFKDEEMIHATIGDKLALMQQEWVEETEESKDINCGEVIIGGFAKEPPMGMMIQENNNQLDLIMSKTAYTNLMNEVNKQTEVSSHSSMYLTSKDPMGLQKDIEELQQGSEARLYNIDNIYEAKQTSEQMQTVMKVFIYGFIVLITLVSVANIFNTISTSIALRKREFAMLRSVGMTPRGFNQMINFESIFYGLKALIYGLPISFMMMIVLYKQLNSRFDFDFFVPVNSILTVIVSVFVIVGVAMFYSGAKVKGQNIIEGLKDSNL